MWLGPALFVAISVFLWRYIGAVFVPELLVRFILSILPVLRDMELVLLVNAAIFYFGMYFVFAIFWRKLRRFLLNPFMAGVTLWLVNVIIVFPALGRGILGYRTPQGWLAASFPLFVAHWIFARGLQFQDRRS